MGKIETRPKLRRQAIRTTVGQLREILADILSENDDHMPDDLEVQLNIINRKGLSDTWVFENGWGRG